MISAVVDNQAPEEPAAKPEEAEASEGREGLEEELNKERAKNQRL